MTYGLTQYGFIAKRLPDVKNSFEDDFIATYGNIDVTAQSVFGQLIGVLSLSVTDSWENDDAIYNAMYPSTAEGASLDNVVSLNGITRLTAERTSVIGVCNGSEGTLITQNSLVQLDDSNTIFYCASDTLITQSDAYYTEVSLLEMDTQAYSLTIDSATYTYSLPTITFTGSFVTSNSIVVTINGTTLGAVPFNTDNNTTLADLATAIQGNVDVLTAVETNPNIIDITPVSGENVIVNSIVITGGASQPTSAITYRIPECVITFDADFVTGNSIVFNLNGTDLTAIPFNTSQAQTATDIETALEAESEIDTVTISGSNRVFTIVANAGNQLYFPYVTITSGATQPTYTIENPVIQKLADIVSNVVSSPVIVDNGDSTMNITSTDSSVSFSITAGTNFQVTDVSTPVVFFNQEYGAIPAPANTLTNILTQLAGWNSVTNPEEGVLGRDIETDSELRIRRKNSVKILGVATVEAIRARILQEVSGVTSAFVFENKTLQQEDLEIVFSIDLVTGNAIIPTVNGVAGSTVNFTSTHLNTMNLIKAELETFTTLISSVTVGGTGNRTLTITPNYCTDVEATLGITGGATVPNLSYSGGRLAKSFEVVAEGGTDEDIADQIWLTKPAGIATSGNTSYDITDSMGVVHAIRFSRPTDVYIWVTCALTLYTEETFPTNGAELVANAILAYGQSLEIGEDVIIQRVLCQIYEVTGIADGTMTIAATASTGDSPSYGTSNISISDTEISNWDLSRIQVTVV